MMTVVQCILCIKMLVTVWGCHILKLPQYLLTLRIQMLQKIIDPRNKMMLT